MKVIFRSKDFATIEGTGFGFNNRRPAVQAWHYLGRVQHLKWVGWYECHWEGAELVWIVHGDERLFGLAAALKSKGFVIEVKQDGVEMGSHPSNDANEY
jgi:hypothetical protein